ncbi:MAG: pyroglutamyl-peptidase I [Atopobiaceae bacterium]|jgi:pyroglutamyl-peptidase
MANMQPIIVTGFEPFGGQTINASWEAVKLLPDTIANHPVNKLLLPVEFGRSGDMLCEAMALGEKTLASKDLPCLVVCVGEAGGRSAVSVERVAVNVQDARIPDNAGATPHEECIVAGGPAAFFSRLPLHACVEAARSEHIPAEISNTAGLYVCNQLMYRLLMEVQKYSFDILGGFVHVPYTPAEACGKNAVPSMESCRAAKGLEAVVLAALSTCEHV